MKETKVIRLETELADLVFDLKNELGEEGLKSILKTLKNKNNERKKLMRKWWEI